MARPGRKRKWNAQRRKTTREGRQPKATPTPERLLKMAELVGYEVKGYHTDCSSPLRVLQARGVITASMVDAGHRYTDMHRATFPKLQAKISSIGSRQGKGSISMPSEYTDDKAIEAELNFWELNKALTRLSKNIQYQVNEVTIDWGLPAWFVRSVNGTMTTNDDIDRDDMIEGLTALIN